MEQLLAQGIPVTTQGAEFVSEEQSAAWARGDTSGNWMSGWSIPQADAGDFWALYSEAETFAANTGWRYLLSPQQLIAGLSQGMATASQEDVFAWMAKQTNVDTTAMPWATSGLNATQWTEQSNNMNDLVYQLTGQKDFASAGLSSSDLTTAVMQGWNSQQLQDYIQKNPSLNQQYGYLQYGYNYQSFQNYQTQNQQALQSRYGKNFTSQQAIQNLANPLTTFHATGGAFGQFQPYVTSSEKQATGYASAVR